MRMPVLIAAVVACASAAGAAEKVDITAEEHAACDADALALCGDTIPDIERTLSCMRTNVKRLTPGCTAVFRAGLKRRNIPF